MKCCRLASRQSGLTMIEIMIALTIGVFLVGGIFQIFLSGKQVYRMQEGLSRVQENARFAMEFITHDIRMADYFGCFANGAGGISNNLNFAGNPAAFDYSLGAVTGTQGLVNGGNSALDASDSITFRGASGSGILLTSVSGSASDPLTAAAHGFNANELLFVTDCNNADIFQASSTTANTIAHAATGTPGNSSANLSDTYGTDAQLYRVSTIKYDIQAGAGGRPALFRQIDGAAATELVEGIENMQILYGENTDADRTPNYYVPADSVVDMANVVSVYISLLVASSDDNLASQPIDYTYNGATTTPADRRIRRVFTSTIALRNRL